jgi:hypothetical protein
MEGGEGEGGGCETWLVSWGKNEAKDCRVSLRAVYGVTFVPKLFFRFPTFALPGLSQTSGELAS